MVTNKPLQVAAGVIKNSQGQLLIAQRKKHVHQGGLWEFPGGKIEVGETVSQALIRELQEELGIKVQAITPLIEIRHQYPDLAVQLHVYQIDDFTGEAQGLEGQCIKWVAAEELTNYAFPKANLPIISAVKLPHSYAILDDADGLPLLTKLQSIVQAGVTLIQARLKRSSKETIEEFTQAAIPLCAQYSAILLVNSAVEASLQTQFDGVHLTSRDLMQQTDRAGYKGWLAASCHNLQELKHAPAIGADFAVLAPIQATQTHPQATGLGWDLYQQLLEQVNIPVYALGGMGKKDERVARSKGGQGIAGIRLFLD